jgi:hypothetical protein|tara:strand:- start:49 stop:687 length:639 start_codon:yes stop_codon:yes gene_type:complete
MGAGPSADDLKGKTRDEMLALCFEHLGRGNEDEDKVVLQNLMCMADDLSPAEVEGVRNDFVKIDRNDKGYILLDDYQEYYKTQAADVSNDEFRIFCSGIISSSHWSTRQLENAGVNDEARHEREDEEKKIIQQMIEEQRIKDAIEHDRLSKEKIQRIKMIAGGSGSMVDWTQIDKDAQRRTFGQGGGRLKAKMMGLGFFANKHKDQKTAKRW